MALRPAVDGQNLTNPWPCTLFPPSMRLVKRYGEDAVLEAAARNAIERLQAKAPAGGEKVY